MKHLCKALVTVLLVGLSVGVDAQIPQYGTSMNLEMAKKVVAAAELESRKNN